MSLNNESPPDCPSFEDALENLEAIVHELEEGQIGLADALARYEQGVKLLKQCFGMLEGAERKIEFLSGFDAAGNPVAATFDDESSAARDEKGEARSRRPSADKGKPAPPKAKPDKRASTSPSADETANVDDLGTLF
jgi:exodeoxyribonuclease VII small subunit